VKVFLSRPRGFCAGVERAIEVVLKALEKFGRPVYVRHEIVHNRVVVEGLEAKGAVFVPSLTDVPIGQHVIFSAHGVAPVAVLTQTTLSIDEAAQTMAVLRRRFPNVQTPRQEDICYATTNRQMAVKDLNGDVDLWLVIGDKTSSNSNRLREIGASSDVPAYLIIDASQIQSDWLIGVSAVGVTSGASTPEVSVQTVVRRLRELGATEVEEVDGVSESVEFQLPREVR